jgi:hypothetical protein
MDVSKNQSVPANDPKYQDRNNTKKAAGKKKGAGAGGLKYVDMSARMT